MKSITKALLLAISVVLLAGCSKHDTGTAMSADFKLAADMNMITNGILKHGEYVKEVESGRLGKEVSFQIVCGTNSDQRHYILTWKDSKWHIAPTNH
jgi:hypothetical protein